MPRAAATATATVLMLCCLLGAAPGAPESSGKPAVAATADAKQTAHIEKLRKLALGADPAASDRALAELKSLGGPGHKALLGSLRQVLTRDKSAVLAAAARLSTRRAADRFTEVRERIESTREAALANLEDLRTGEPVVEARRHYDQLVKDLPEFNATLAARESIVRLMGRRPGLVKAYREAAPPDDPEFGEAAEAKLAAAAEKALGTPPAEAPPVPRLGEGDPPDDPLLRHLWFYRACRDVDAYNETLRREVSKAEWDNLVLVNRYREALGVLPFELDARLVQSARRHSREMHEEAYFSHESPTPGLRGHADRMRAAGYADRPFGENIAVGPPSASLTFEAWFDSPGHHRIMVHAASTAIGVGKWERYWTQNTGVAPRLMLQPPAERAKARVEGPLLKPQR